MSPNQPRPDLPGSDGDPGLVVVQAAGELDAAGTEFATQLQAVVDAGARHVVVDFLEVTFIDSSVVGAFVLAHQAVTGAGGWIRIVYTHHLIGRVIDILGLAEIFPQYATVAAAGRGAVARHQAGDAIGDRG